jgi:hypothetical protein
MLTAFVIFAVAVVSLLYWIGTNVRAIANRAEPTAYPDDEPLSPWQKHALE